jgi:2-isopropylmalate synthase
MSQVYLYDTTLRDGAQAEGISYSVHDKLQVLQRLGELGLPYVEGGWPGSNPKDAEFFRRAAKLKLKGTTLTAFGSTRRADNPASRDSNLNALLCAETPVITLFGKSWDLHARDILKISPDANLKLIEDSVAFLVKRGRQVFYDAEHFFDGYKANPVYAFKTVQAALQGGASVVIFCDTNGGALPAEISRILRECLSRVKVATGIHTHNDSELAVANAIAAVEAGVAQVQGVVNGYGERCGNANLVTLAANLQLKMGMRVLDRDKLRELTEVSHFVAEVSNLSQHPNQPYVGASAFAHKGGVHVNAVLKNPLSYEHIDPGSVGNQRRILVSELSGRSSLVSKARELEIGLAKDTPQAKRLLLRLQDLEHSGYHFEAADGSLQLLIKRELQKLEPFFSLESFRIVTEKRQRRSTSEATIKLRVKGQTEHAAAEGDGPVNALDNAIRKALLPFYPSLAGMHLTDFKVRVLDEKAGTAAKVRVLIQSQDEHDSWGTVGVSENIIEASWQALVDSIEYKLLKERRSEDRSQMAEDRRQKSEDSQRRKKRT